MAVPKYSPQVLAPKYSPQALDIRLRRSRGDNGWVMPISSVNRITPIHRPLVPRLHQHTSLFRSSIEQKSVLRIGILHAVINYPPLGDLLRVDRRYRRLPSSAFRFATNTQHAAQFYRPARLGSAPGTRRIPHPPRPQRPGRISGTRLFQTTVKIIANHRW